MLCSFVLVSAVHHHESAIGMHMPLLLEPPSHLPSHPTPLGCHRALDLSSLHYTANSHWPSILYMVMYMINLDSILKSRDITLSTKVRLVKAMVFPVVMYGCESWTVKKLECQRIEAFELQCWRRLVRVPWTARRSNQSILKEINPGISLEE